MRMQEQGLGAAVVKVVGVLLLGFLGCTRTLERPVSPTQKAEAAPVAQLATTAETAPVAAEPAPASAPSSTVAASAEPAASAKTDMPVEAELRAADPALVEHTEAIGEDESAVMAAHSSKRSSRDSKNKLGSGVASIPGGTLEAIPPSGPREYTGQRISLDFKDADIQNVLRILADVSGLNIITTDDVQGKITMRLVEVPWDQALDSILRARGLDGVRDGNIIRVSTVEKLKDEREALRAANEAQAQAEPLRVRYIKVNYAKADEKLVKKIQEILTDRGSVTWDERTNTIVVRDIDRGIADSEELISHYDFVVFPGHTEYVTQRLYDHTRGYRDLGGRLIFLSANNFFRHVKRTGDVARLVGEWRNEGKPESAVLGSQYLANDSGQRQEPFTVTGADVAPWLFAGTGLSNGSQFGKYGIEIDATTPSSPPGTQVLAQIPDLLGPGRTAQMTYYEMENGAAVFSAGVLNFGGTIMLWREPGRILDNVWARLTPH